MNGPFESITERERPYGKAPYSLGIHANDLLLDLSDVPKWSEHSRRWVPSDHWSFQSWFNIEDQIPLAQAEPKLGEDEIIYLNDILTRFHVALPFDEAEREWLLTAYDEAWGPNSISIIRTREATLVSNGLQRVVQGRDLARRWWSWRREANEFSGQGSLSLARDALYDLIQRYSPDQKLPESFLALQPPTKPVS
jgi:hypothetical protein